MSSNPICSKLLFTFNFICLIGFKFSEVKASAASRGRGFGEEFKWLNLDEGIALSSSDNKPLMVIIHKTWCGACKALKPKFAASLEIKKLSKHFIMVNVEDNEEPKDEMFSPDGGYIPRILFLAPGGKVREEFYNANGDPSYKYFYSDPGSIIVTMKKVLKAFSVTDKVEL